MNNQEAIVLLDKYLAGECSLEEYKLLIRAYNLEIPAEGVEPTQEEYEASRILVLRKLQAFHPEIRNTKIKIWPRIASAVAAVALIVFGVWFFNYRIASMLAPSENTVMDHLSPGKNGATISLANGSVIELSELQSGVLIGTDRMTYPDGSAVSDQVIEASQSEMLTATTSKGQTYFFTLPDGTGVWLNADSRLSFPQPFTGNTRDVFLEGEAYFEVAKDLQHPFIVTSGGQQVEVLGTHFNINSYPGEPAIATTLIEGSVSIKAGNLQKIIKPGEQSLNVRGDIRVVPVDVDKVVDWKNGDFNFNQVDFKTAMRKIARWYNVEVVYDASVPDTMEAGGWMSRNNKLSDVLQAIEASGHAGFKIEGNKVIVSK